MLCISTASGVGSFPERIAALADVGFSSVTLGADDVATFAANPKALVRRLATAGLSVSSVGPIEPTDNFEDAISIAKAVDASAIVIDVSTFKQEALPNLEALGPLKLALLPSRENEDVVYSYVCGRAHPNLGLSLNSARVLSDGSRPARLRDLRGEFIFHVELMDGKNGQLLPGLGDLNLQGFVRVLSRLGYIGPWAVTGQNDPENGYRALVNILDEVAVSEPSAQFHVPQLPARVPAMGIEFIEFAVDEETAADLTKMLSSMSFRQERRHMTKDVTLWRQGAVNVVINQDAQGYARKAFNEHGASVCDMGLRVRNADETVARARALGAKSFVQNVGLGELEIPAIRGVGGSIVHFIDEKSDLHRVWDIEFDAVKRTKAPQPAGLRRIDHVAQTMKYDDMQRWLLYYISTFEMEKSAIVNVNDPSGVVLSQAIESPEGDVRLNLNGALGMETIAGAFVADTSGAGVQHLAFATDDIFETSKLLDRQGFARLQIDQQYFQGIQKEYELDDELIAILSSENILYDRDEAGEYFQIYSQNLFGGFFFEIVQRRNGYAGYGARNAPIRLQAQTNAKENQTRI